MISNKEEIISKLPEGWALEDSGSQMRYVKDRDSVVFHLSGSRVTRIEYLRGDCYHRNPVEGPAAIKLFDNGDVYGQFFLDGEAATTSDTEAWKRIGRNLFSLQHSAS